MTSMAFLRWTLALCVAPGLTPAAASTQDADGDGSLEAYVAAGDWDAAVVAMEDRLELEPDDVPTLMRAADIAVQAEDRDRALWYAQLALANLSEDAETAERAALEARTEELDTAREELSGLLGRYESFARSLFDLGRTSKSGKLYVNALDLFQRCRGTRFEAKAEAELAEMFEDPNAASALIQSGVDVPPPPKSRQEFERIARLDAKHADWSDPHRVETRNYVVLCNMGYEWAHSIASAMEQMNEFYRRVFNVRGRLSPCEIRVYRTREEFDLHEGSRSANIKGFYVPSRNYVATYDPRSERWPIAGLWSTLFHEASHQFTHEAASGLTPGWLNEGTASYFEGAALLPNKSVITNDIPSMRLYGAAEAIGQGSPTLDAVIRYFEPGSYPGDYYPVGWSLVYFLQNYEDERFERPYQKPYQDFLNAYRKQPKDEPFELFQKLIVKGSRQKDAATFEAFEQRWKSWVVDLASRYEEASRWVALARQQVEHRQKDAALESFRFALLDEPENLAALFHSADLYADLRKRDEAIYNYRKILRRVYALPPDQELEGLEGKKAGQLVEDCLASLERLHKGLAEVTRQSLLELPEAALAAAEAYREKDLPRQALRILDDALALLGENPDLRGERERIRTVEGVDVRRWRRLRIDDSLEDWEVTGDWRKSQEGLECTTRGTAFVTYRESMPEEFRLEARLRTTGMNGAPVAGVVFTSDDFYGVRIFGLYDQKTLRILKLEEDGIGYVDSIRPLKGEDGEDLLLSVDVRGSSARVLVDGQALGSHSYRVFPGGRIGLFVDALDYPTKHDKIAEVEFVDLRVYY